MNCFRDYVTLKLHFNEPRFMWSQKKGEKITEESLYKRSDFDFFDILTRKIKDREERQQFLISCFLRTPSIWIGDIIENFDLDFHKKRMIRVNSLEYTFKNEMENVYDYMMENHYSVKDMLLSRGDSPRIIMDQHNIAGGVSDETLALINKGFRFCDQETNDPLWKQRAFVLTKYQYFLEVKRECMTRHFTQLASIESKAPVTNN